MKILLIGKNDQVGGELNKLLEKLLDRMQHRIKLNLHQHYLKHAQEK